MNAKLHLPSRMRRFDLCVRPNDSIVNKMPEDIMTDCLPPARVLRIKKHNEAGHGRPPSATNGLTASFAPPGAPS